MKRNALLKYLIGIALVLIILAVVGKKAGWFGKPETIEVSVENPQIRTITESISANGKIQPVVEVKISPEVSGEIIELTVKEGDRVEKGQLLCRIKPDTYISIKERTIAAVNSAKARLTQTQAQLQQSELSFNRSKQLFEQKAISESEFESAKTSYQVAKADVQAAIFNVESAEASLKEAEESLRKTTIYAPVSGTVSKLNVELGERVVGTAQMAGTEILRLANLSNMEARVNVNENDIVRVKLNDTALIDVDAYTEDKFKGIVTQIANSASVTGSTTDQVTTFEVRILMLEDSYKHLVTAKKPNPFRPGMSTTVDIQTTTKRNILTVPIQAVTTRSDSVSIGAKGFTEVTEGEQEDVKPKTELKEVVFITAGDTAKMVTVKTGIQDNRYIQVTEGLTGEEEVVVAPFSAISRKLSDNKLVTKVEKDKLFKVKK
ncbi:MAG TPA: efflux RND transporter periplasmic adaptor subunit [Tenuifilaceae bacterium]|nr:efflux RND transporter periplasmic adaptor subunit [Tenuifilaceae bacterium]HPE17028.1 efflux RND transporter periplasmic adaptor subunit [Tenuifilaceae bacterium]HPJ44687.1 efflux RND transporter periplasmic adaptor subunit [Tenuifilaceae bacterium]HPQ32951.1 efflux RND transporter periplasmic adaptor subunit [Tenuifilaceae bacterium]HRX66769.1 efflux RND transporter periplasmic adaptor subunit [Tenuifilaceae bacterium]